MKNRMVLYGSLVLLLAMVTANSFKPAPQTGNITFTFINTVKGIPIVLNDSLYSNSFGEQYNIKNLKYYISNISLGVNTGKAENYQLVDEASDDSKTFSITVPAGNYNTVNFTLGVDSLHNVSGAQAGALDPLNGMFWTWNSGYIMAKLEGSSPSSLQVNNRFEYHIGGFSGINSTVKKISLPFSNQHSSLAVEPGKKISITIEADLDKWWQSPNDITIAATPVCTTPGELAKKIADNYSKLFTVKTVTTD